MKDCSAEAVFGCPEELIQGPPWGYVVNQGGPNGLDIRIPHWGVADDPCKVPGCEMALCKFLDGSPIAVRYRREDIK